VGAAQDEAAVLSEPKTPFRFVPQNLESAKADFAQFFSEAKANLGLSRSELFKLLQTAA
jgi:hypothetical protein